MKIAITADPEIPVPPLLYGGIERIVYMLVQELVTMGHDVTLFAHADSEVPCRLISWPGKKSSSQLDSIKNAAVLFKWALREKYDVIHSFSRLAYLTPLLPLAIPKVMSYQREPSVNQISKAVKLSKNGSLLFTGCSNYITEKIKAVTNAYTVYNCVSIEQYDFVEHVREEAPMIFLGRIEPIKGAHLAIEVAERTGKRLIIAGNVPEEGKIYFRDQIQPRLNDKISYVGPVNDTQKNQLLGQSICFLMPIQWNEPFGIVMAEAMACGTPVIGFPHGSVPEVIIDGINGFICQNVNDMIIKTDQLIKVDRRKVRRDVEERFNDKVISRNYISVYQEVRNNVSQKAV